MLCTTHTERGSTHNTHRERQRTTTAHIHREEKRGSTHTEKEKDNAHKER